MYKFIQSLKQWFSNTCIESKNFSEEYEIYLENCSGFIKLNKENLLKNSKKWTTGNYTKKCKNFIVLFKIYFLFNLNQVFILIMI